MKKRSLKKGFTLVELVVVIAVIAVLAAVSVGAYFGITETANLQAAKTHVKQLNDMLLLSEIGQYKKNDTCHEARNDMRLQGLDIIELDEFSSYRYAWDSVEDRIALVDISKHGSNGEGYIVYPNEVEVTQAQKARYFLFVKSQSELNNDKKWSYYLHDDFVFENEELTIQTESGIDTGYVRPNSIVYSSNLEQSVIFNTNYFNTELIINNPNGTIKHFGYSKSINADSFADGGYQEHGIVGRLTVGSEARDRSIILTKFSEVFRLNAKAEKVTRNGKLHSESNSIIVSCGASHMNYRLMCDFKYVYNFCEECGYITDNEGKNCDDVEVGVLLIEENSSFNNGKKHVIGDTKEFGEGDNKYKVSFCENCSFNYKPYKGCAHIWQLCDDLECEQLNSYKCILCNTHDNKPKANVDEVEDKNVGEVLWADGMLWDEEVPNASNPLTLDTRFIFKAVDRVDENGILKASIDYEIYKNYIADFIVSFNRKTFNDYEDEPGENNTTKIAVEKNTVGLWGKYGGFTVAFHNGLEIPAGLEIPLLGMMGAPFTYEAIVNEVKDFECGAFNCSESNEGLVLTVTLALWDPNVYSFDNNTFTLSAPTLRVGTWLHEFSGEKNCHHIQ